MSNWTLNLDNEDTLNICLKDFGSKQFIIDKMTAIRTRTIFPNCIKKGLCLYYHKAYTGRSTPTITLMFTLQASLFF